MKSSFVQVLVSCVLAMGAMCGAVQAQMEGSIAYWGSIDTGEGGLPAGDHLLVFEVMNPFAQRSAIMFRLAKSVLLLEERHAAFSYTVTGLLCRTSGVRRS